MKIKGLTKRRTKLLQLNILKLKLHRKLQLNSLEKSTKQTELYFKKVIQIIYRYHLFGKRILFLGFPLHFQDIVKRTKHILIPESSWLNGLITNQILKPNYLLTKQQKRLPFKVVKLLLHLKKKIDLVVVFNLNQNFNAVEESYISRIPIVGGVEQLNMFDEKVTYKLFHEFKLINFKIATNNFFTAMVKLVLKQAILMSSKRLQTSYSIYVKEQFERKYRKSLKISRQFKFNNFSTSQSIKRRISKVNYKNGPVRQKK